MAITSRLVGKFGGGVEVESVPVSATEVTGTDVDHVLAEVDAGDGALVVLTADITHLGSTGGNWVPELRIGDSRVRVVRVGEVGVAAHVSGIVPVIVRTRAYSVTGRMSLTGTVHTIPHPIA